jgi:hypothetical protein
MKQLPAHPHLEGFPGPVGIGAQLPRGVVEQLAAALVARLGPGIDRAFDEAPGRIADDEALVVLQHRAEAVAAAARPSGIVEREQQRGKRCRYGVAGAAGELLGESEPAGRVEHDRDPFALDEGQRDGFPDPVDGRGGLPLQHHQQIPGLGEVESGRQLLEVERGAVGHQPAEPQGAKVVHQREVGDPGRRGHREGDLDRDIAQCRSGLGRARRGIANHRLTALPAEGNAGPRPQQPQKVVDFGGGADGGTA